MNNAELLGRIKAVCDEVMSIAADVLATRQDAEQTPPITESEALILQTVADAPLRAYAISRRCNRKCNTTLYDEVRSLKNRGLLEQVPSMGVQTTDAGKEAMRIFSASSGPKGEANP